MSAATPTTGAESSIYVDSPIPDSVSPGVFGILPGTPLHKKIQRAAKRVNAADLGAFAAALVDLILSGNPEDEMLDKFAWRSEQKSLIRQLAPTAGQLELP